jgi:uncharacterized protein (DUF3820 family)
MTQDINTHNVRIDFGRHKGELFTRLPVSYLKWMVNEVVQDDLAKAELKRRGTTTPELDVSGHAVDRASLRCRRIWHETSAKGQGLHSWLVQMSKEALSENGGIEAVMNGGGKAESKGMVFVFDLDGQWPVLKTLHRMK